MIRCNNRV